MEQEEVTDLGVPESTMSLEDRNEYISYLIIFTDKPPEDWEKRSDREVIEAYSKLIKLD